MGKKLIITEKPSVARDFARVLKVSGNRNGYIENDTYVISWCYGHLVEMSYPESYDIKYKTWRLENLPFLPEDYKYNVIESSKDQYELVHSLLFREDIDTVYWAGDSGKEGQTIEENIRMYGGVRDGMTELRVWIDSQTDDEIIRGINEAKPMSEYDLLGKSGIMRTIEDYALGINFSRALSVKYGKMINDAAATDSYTAIAIGRVMTCVLGMVVRREREIRNFEETPFYRVLGDFSDAHFKAEWKAVEGSKYLDSPLLYKENGFKKEESAQNLISELLDKPAIVDSIEQGTMKKKPPLLFNLAELQSECSKLFKISPQETLQIAQTLYESKLTTYPRTDARVLTTAVAKEIHKNMRELSKLAIVEPYVKEILGKKLYQGIEKSIYTDDSKVTDHYAIIPTGLIGAVEKLNPLQRKVYELIVRRFLAIFYPPAEFKTLKLAVKIDNEKLFSQVKLLVNPGYMQISGILESKDDEEDGTCSKEAFLKFAETIKKGDTIDVNGFEIKEGKTSPPKRYTSGNLILAMENAGNLIEDEELREQIKKSGIGTSATRGEILDKLVRIHYLNQNNKTQVITPENLGEMIYEVVFLSVPSLLNPEMTASWERGLEGIVSGKVDHMEYRGKLEDFIRKETMKMVESDLTKDIAMNIHDFLGKGAKGSAVRVPIGLACPLCGGEVNTTSFGYGCSNYYDESKKCGFAVGTIAGRALSKEEVITLVTTGNTDVLEGFVSKSGKPFKASLKGSLGEDHVYKIEFDFSKVAEEPVEGIKCPACGGRILKTGYGYACENRIKDSACYFGIGDIAEKSITKEQVIALLTDGTTEPIKGFKSGKNKSTFTAKLKLLKNEEDRYTIRFDFEGIEPEYVDGVVCPDCGGRIMVKSFGFGCENYNKEVETSCRFAIGKLAGKQLSASNVQELLKEGHTKTIRGFKSKNGKKFDACLILTKDEAGKSVIKFDFENVEAKQIKDVVCPICHSAVVKTRYGYACSAYKGKDAEDGCKFNIGKISGVLLNESQLKDLLTKGITDPIDTFVAKTGMMFEAMLALDKDENGIVKGCKFVFGEEDKELPEIKCPKCHSNMIKTYYGYKCSGYKKDDESACRFIVGKIAGRSLSEAELKQLIETRKTETLDGFVSKNGNPFSAALSLDEDNNIRFEFT